MQISLTAHKTRAFLEGKLTAAQFELLRQIPGRSKWVGKTFWFEKTAANIEYLRKHFKEAVWIDEVNRLEQIDALRQFEKDGKEQEYSPDNFQFKTKPFEHQLRGFLKSRDRKSYGILFEQGTGKTKVTIDTIAYLFLKKKINIVLIIAPNGVHRQWVTEQLKEHMPDSVKYRTMIWSAGRRVIPAIMEQTPELRIISVNTEALSHDKTLEEMEKFLLSGTAMIVLDESSRIKNHKAKRTKNILSLRGFAEYRRILSGTPITNGVENLYSQFYFLDPDIFGFSSFYTFRNRYCTTKIVPGTTKRVAITGYKNLDEIDLKLESHSMRVTKAECLDLPDKIYIERLVDLTSEQRKAYEELRDDLFTMINDEDRLETRVVVVQLMRLQQIVCGFAVTENGIRDLPTNRIEVALDLVEETSGKGIIWSRFSRDIDKLYEEMKTRGIKALKYDGRTTDKAAVIDKFKKQEDVRWLIANQAAGGIGLNLTVADTIIYFSNTFSAETRWQSEDRTHRIGQKNRCTYFDLISPGTIDRKILFTLRQKKDLALNILDLKRLLISED